MATVEGGQKEVLQLFEFTNDESLHSKLSHLRMCSAHFRLTYMWVPAALDYSSHRLQCTVESQLIEVRSLYLPLQNLSIVHYVGLLHLGTVHLRVCHLGTAHHLL